MYTPLTRTPNVGETLVCNMGRPQECTVIAVSPAVVTVKLFDGTVRRVYVCLLSV